jgi:hypothetical protein
MRLPPLLPLALVAAFLLVACGSKEPESDPGPPPECLEKRRSAEPDEGASYDRVCSRCARLSTEVEQEWSCGLTPIVETTEKLAEGSILWTRTGGPGKLDCAHDWHRMGGGGFSREGHGRLYVPFDSRPIWRLAETAAGVAALLAYSDKSKQDPLAIFGKLVRYAGTKDEDGYVHPFAELEKAVDAGVFNRDPTTAEMVGWLEQNMSMIEQRVGVRP